MVGSASIVAHGQSQSAQCATAQFSNMALSEDPLKTTFFFFHTVSKSIRIALRGVESKFISFFFLKFVPTFRQIFDIDFEILDACINSRALEARIFAVPTKQSQTHSRHRKTPDGFLCERFKLNGPKGYRTQLCLRINRKMT